jgi:hypothetical protein
VLGEGETREMDRDDEMIWRELIHKYLRPLIANEKEINQWKQELKALQSMCVSAFI